MHTLHKCMMSDGVKVGCMCVRGEDHPEELFDIPMGEEPAPLREGEKDD